MSIIVNGVELTEVIYAGVNLDTIKVKKGAAEAVSVFEKITQLATPQNVSADGTTVSWDEVENATSYEVLADGTSIGTVENVTEDALAGTWVFNDDCPNLLERSVSFTFNFMVKEEPVSTLVIDPSSAVTPADIVFLYYDDIAVADSTGELAGIPTWIDDAYKTITITSKLSEVTNGDQLLTWLQANATKQ